MMTQYHLNYLVSNHQCRRIAIVHAFQRSKGARQAQPSGLGIGEIMHRRQNLSNAPGRITATRAEGHGDKSTILAVFKLISESVVALQLVDFINIHGGWPNYAVSLRTEMPEMQGRRRVVLRSPF
jgi:hypothetical protein